MTTDPTPAAPGPAPLDVSWDTFADSIAQRLHASLENLATGAAEDLQRYANVLTRDVVLATRTGRPELRDVVLNQMQLLAEIHRVRLVKEHETLLFEILNALIDGALALLGAAAGGARPS